MPRPPRAAEGGLIYHALNRANARLAIFSEPDDYLAFERVLVEAVALVGVRLLSYVVMPDHFHLVVWPTGDGDLSRFMRWLTLTHTQRWHAHHGSAGSGHLYQGRFKSFPVQADEHLLAVCRYVERNPVRAGLARRAERWRWGSLWWRVHPSSKLTGPPLTPWPIAAPADWPARVNAPMSEADEQAVLQSLRRGRPFGSLGWRDAMVARLGLESTVRPRGRPRKIPEIGS